MRVLRCLAVGLLSVAGGLAVSVGATPASAAPNFIATLTLDPPSGKANTTITATFQIEVPDGTHCRMRVAFRWDDRTLGTQRADSCRLTVHLKAPRDGRDQGPHQVRATETTSHIEASATFLVTDADATPTATPTRPRTTAPADDGSAAGPPLPLNTATVDPSAAQALPQPKASSSMFTPVALIFGGALVLGGVAILAIVILRMRRGEPEPDLGERADYPTQPLYRTTQPIRFGHHAVTATQPLEYPPPPEVPG
jgi:hypothetical protein